MALHKEKQPPTGAQTLDHIGFILNEASDVDAWYEFLLENNVAVKTQPRTHRDGARSFYCSDPNGITVQMIYHPPLRQAKWLTGILL